MAADPIAPLSIPRMGTVPEAAPMTNSEYEQQVDKKLEAIRDAATRLVQMQNPPQPGGGQGLGTGYTPTPWGSMGGVVRTEGDKPFSVPIDAWRPVFLEFQWPNLEAAVGLDAQFTAPGDGPLNRLCQLGSDGGPGKGNWIRDALNEWYSPDAESASRLFKDRYCNDINEMVSAQIQMMQAFQLILRSQTTLIELGRCQALRIADATIQKLGKEIKAEHEQSKQFIKDFAGAVTGVSATGTGLEILRGVVGAIGDFAVNEIVDRTLNAQGEEPWDITDWMLGMLAELRRQLRQDLSPAIQSGIKKLDWYLTGKGAGAGKNSTEKLLPAKVAL